MGPCRRHARRWRRTPASTAPSSASPTRARAAPRTRGWPTRRPTMSPSSMATTWCPAATWRRCCRAWRRGAVSLAYHATIVGAAGAWLWELRVHGQPCTDNRFSRKELADDAAALGEWQPCLRVFRTRLFDGIRFPPSRYYEDAAVLPGLY